MLLGFSWFYEMSSAPAGHSLHHRIPFIPLSSTTRDGVHCIPAMSFKSGSKTKVPAATRQVTTSDRTNSLKCSQSPAVVKQTSAAKQVPKSKQPTSVESKFSSNTKRPGAVVPKQSTSTHAIASGSKSHTTGNDAPSKSLTKDKAKFAAKDDSRSLSEEIEALKAVLAEQAATLDQLKKEMAPTPMPPIKDEEPDSISSPSEDDETELIHKPDPLGNLQVAMGLSDQKRLYNRCRATVAVAMLQEHVPFNVDWRNQHWSTVCKAAERAKELEPQLHKYTDDWAIYEIMKTIAKNRRSYSVRRVRGYTAPVGKDDSSGDQAELAGLGSISAPVGSSVASSHGGENNNGEVDDSDMEDEDHCGANDLEVQDDESSEIGDSDARRNDDSEVGASEAEIDDTSSEVGNSETKEDDGSEGSESDGQAVDDSEIGDGDLPSEGAREIGSDIEVEEIRDDENEGILNMEVVDGDHMVDVGENLVVGSRKDMARKDLKRRLTKDSDPREDDRTAQTDKSTTKRKKK